MPDIAQRERRWLEAPPPGELNDLEAEGALNDLDAAGGALRETDGMLREIEGALRENEGALRELEGAEKLASGLGRSARPLGRGALNEREGDGAGLMRELLGRLSVRGEGRFGIDGALKLDEPRKLDGRVTCEA